MKRSQNRNSNRAGVWRQELVQRLCRVLLTGLLPMASSACSPIEPRTTWPFPCEALIKQMPSRLVYNQSMEEFSQLMFLF